MVGHVRKLLLGLSSAEASFARRGFPATERARQARLEEVGRTFVIGYNAALLGEGALESEMERGAPELAGFVVEGAAMALAILDRLNPWRRDRIARLLDGVGRAHVYMVHVGVGWAAARLRTDLGAVLRDRDPVLRWLVLDGYGFHHAYFDWTRWIRDAASPPVSGDAAEVFDQGVGRAMWFACGADADVIAGAVAGFHARRHASLWSGVGLAAAYAGIVESDALLRLKERAGAMAPHLAQGAAFAATARAVAENPSEHTDIACRLLAGVSAADAAALTLAARGGLLDDEHAPAYEHWRRRVRAQLEGKVA